MPRIVSVHVYALVQAQPDYSWSPVMPDVLNTDTIVRITDDEGCVGVGAVCTFTEYGVDRSVLEQIRPIAINLLAEDDPAPQAFWAKMQMRRPGVSAMAIAAVDMALWDLEARRAGQPLYHYLGGTRSFIEAYASVPILDTPDDFIALIADERAQGFNTFKFHYKSVAAPDIALIHAVAEAHGGQCRFMFDAENLYDLEAGIAVAEATSQHDFIWLEAPFDDYDWASYRALKDITTTPLIPAGNSVIEARHMAQAIDAKCWDILRIDAATAGGITPALTIFQHAQDAGLNVELQSWGSSLSTAANLHLGLAHGHCQYFEIPVPRRDFTVPGAGQFEINEKSQVMAPTGAGIGLELNWPEIAAAASASSHYDD